ncbi:glycosyl transferase family A [Suicoccus acidiformans]|uniref:Glycosyl transferase family A n=1 Tax=Suicoccus acidiformans TaxID=2036206 RepID=A0A347WJP7_9LACT|nr:glycosyltransferase [Suicoccus acidiformans]AXY25304.1 glycosyl transferase family A [Suicoccus acidiformans]
MSNELLLSIIVPIFNTEHYLAECLDSLLSQGITDYEIICINDGSTDNSLEILEKYSECYPFIRVFNQCNKGLSVTRNRGINLAKGKYIYFMDSDDVLEENSLIYIIDQMEQKNLDLYVFDAESFLDDSVKEDLEIIRYDKSQSYGIYETGVCLFEELVKDRVFSPSACLYIIRRGVLINTKLHFIEDILHEDEAFTVEAFLFSARSMHENKFFFKRRIRSDSIMTRKRTVKNFEGYYAVFKRLNQYKSYSIGVRKRIAIIYNSMVDIYLELNNFEQNNVYLQYVDAVNQAKENRYYTLTTWLKHKNSITRWVYEILIFLKNKLMN